MTFRSDTNWKKEKKSKKQYWNGIYRYDKNGKLESKENLNKWIKMENVN